MSEKEGWRLVGVAVFNTTTISIAREDGVVFWWTGGKWNKMPPVPGTIADQKLKQKDEP